VSRIGRGGPDRPQCADAAISRFDRVGIMARRFSIGPPSAERKGATKMAQHLHAERLSRRIIGSMIILAMQPDHIVGCVTAKVPITCCRCSVAFLAKDS
jgi:hypothetical protein